MQRNILKVDLLRTNQASLPSSYMSRLLDGIYDINKRSSLLEKWDDRSKATDTGVHKARNVIIKIVQKQANPFANFFTTSDRSAWNSRTSGRASSGDKCHVHPNGYHTWAGCDTNLNTNDPAGPKCRHKRNGDYLAKKKKSKAGYKAAAA